MAYRSDIVIGVVKEVFVRHLLSPCIPPTLLNRPSTTSDGVVYWRLDGWKWLEGYEEVDEILDFFNTLRKWHDGGDEIHLAEPRDSLFGALRIGEDDEDTETWGYPYDFDIYLNRYISFPNSEGDH